MFAVQVELGSHHQRKVGEVLDDGVSRRIRLVLGHGDGLRGHAKLELHLQEVALHQFQALLHGITNMSRTQIDRKLNIKK